jgi:hypothetical protein
MPERKSIYDVAFGAGAETGKYGAELLKTEDVWERMAHKEKVTDWKIERETAMADTAMSALGLASELYGGFAAKKEFEGALISTQERAGEAAYTKVAKDTDVEWSKLDPSKREEWLGKFTPEKKEQKWYKSLFGEEEEYKFGESDYFKKSSITAARGLSDATSLEKLMDVKDFPAKQTMADDAGLSQKAKEPPEIKKKDDLLLEEKAADEEVVSPGTPDEDEFEYKSGTRAGSKEWFDKQIKQFKQRKQIPAIKPPATGYNVQLEKLAREQGWTGSRWE